MTRVKVCGIRRRRDALLAAECGADAVGVLVGRRHPSPDFISADAAARILAALPPFVHGVLVSHLEDPGELSDLIDHTRARVVQVHGPMAPEGLRELRQRQPGLTILRALHVLGPDCVPAAEALAPWVDGLVADSANPRTGQVGGTGLVHDWRLSARVRESAGVPLILAGGLHAGNVAEAIARVRPWAVDVNSGVKGPEGYKDPERVRRFLAAVCSRR